MIGISTKFDIVETWVGEYLVSIRTKRVSDKWIQIVTVVYRPKDPTYAPGFGMRSRLLVVEFETHRL